MAKMADEIKQRERELRDARAPFEKSRPHSPAKIVTDRVLRLDELTRELLRKDGERVEEFLEPILTAEEERYWSTKASGHAIAQRVHIERQYRRIPFKEILEEKPREIELLPAFGRTGLADRIVIGYNVVCTAVMSRQQQGAWPIVLADLLEDADKSSTLISDAVPDLVRNHPSSERVLLAAGIDELSRLSAVAKATEMGLAGKIGKLIDAAKKVPEVLRKLAEYYVLLDEAYERLKKEVEQFLAEQKAKAEAEAKQREIVREIEERTREGSGHELPGSRDAIDAFERNGDIISRTC